MNLTSSLLALALLGMDDTQPKPDLPPKGSVEIEIKVDAEAAPKTVSPFRIRQRDLRVEASRAGRYPH